MGASTSLALPDRIAVSESMHSHQPRWVFVPVRVRDPATGRVQGFGPFRNGEPFVPSVRITSPGPATSTLANRTQLRWAPTGAVGFHESFPRHARWLHRQAWVGVGPRIGWVRGDWCWLLCDAWRYWAGLAGPSSHEVCAL